MNDSVGKPTRIVILGGGFAGVYTAKYLTQLLGGRRDVELLELTGARLRTAYDGEMALELGAQLEPDIILLDIDLPGMSGYEVAERARRTPWGARAFIVALTGWGNEEARARTRAAGFDRHLVKPVDPRQLLELIAEVRDRSVPVVAPLDLAR